MLIHVLLRRDSNMAGLYAVDHVVGDNEYRTIQWLELLFSWNWNLTPGRLLVIRLVFSHFTTACYNLLELC